MVRHVHENDPKVEDVESELRIELGENQHLVDVFKAAIEMESLNESPAGQALAKQCVDAIQAAFDIFLRANADDLASSDVRKAHFDAVVAVKVLGLINDLIGQGKEAERFISARDDGETH